MLTLKYKLYKSRKNKRLDALCDTGGVIWNHIVALNKRYYSLYKKGISLNRLQKHIAKLRNRNPYWKRLNAQSVQEIGERYDLAMKRFFNKLAKRPPKFKKRTDSKSVVFKQYGYSLKDNRLTINGIGVFKFSKSRDYSNIKRISVKRTTTGDYYLIVCCDLDPTKFKREGDASIGMDFGLKTFLTCSDGKQIESPLFFKQFKRRIAKANKSLSSKKKGSNNRKKAKLRLARLHETVANKRSDFQWKLAHELCKTNDFIAIEDLNIAAMTKLWGRKVNDLSFSAFVDKLIHVSKKYDVVVQKIGRFYPSSKLCECGVKNDELTLKAREWVCKSCGLLNARDALAARNILGEGIRLYRTKCKTSLEAV